MTPRNWFAAAALLVAMFATGCGSPTAKMLGKWQMSASVGGGNPLLSMMASSMKGELDFKGDGSFSMAIKTPLGDKSTAGTWKFVKADGKALVLTVKTADTPERETRLEFTDNDHFSMVPLEVSEATKDLKLDFARVK
ncbi:MAG: hypothetical protein ACKVP0_16265 [Pirellulaceae bacterium]